MDNSRHSSNGWDGRRSGRSSRHRRSKTASLSSRLNPDFDPIYLIRHENELPNNSNVNRSVNNDELDPKTMNFEELVRLLHPTFIADYLQKVLQYLRSDKSEICFPNLAPFKEEFLLKIVDNNDHLKCNKFSHASMITARQILDVVDVYKDVYKWSYTFESGRVTKNVLVYKKNYYKNNSQPSNNFKKPLCPTTSASAPISLATSLEDLNLNRNHDNRQDNSQLRLQKVVKDDRQSLKRKQRYISLTGEGMDVANMTKKEKRTLELKHRIVQNLPEYFIKRSLMEISDFMEDESRSSLEFRDVIAPESRFLECVTALARGKEFYQLFSEDCVVLLRKISRYYLRDTWKLQIDIGKLNKRTKSRTLTMFKVPMSHKKDAARNSSMSERLDDSRNDSSCSIDCSAAPGNRSESKERSSSRRSDSVRKDRDNNSAYPADTLTPKPRSASKDRRKQPLKNGGIAFQSAGAQIVDSTQVADARADGRTRERGLPSRKSKLIEAMSTPLESDRAERMMRLMGWEGGALGARGEGITEPLIPALHILPGAGLGHVKPAPSAPRTPQDFRRYFLQDLLTFLESEERETAILYTEPLSKRESRFVKPAVNAFNDRKNIGLARDQEVRLVKTISTLMREESELRIEIGISDDRRQVRLRKIIDSMLKWSRKTRKKSKLSDSELRASTPTHMKNRDERVNPEEVPVLTTIMDLEKTCLSLKNAKALAYSVLFLQKIKEFLSIEDSEKEYKFDCVLTIKQRTYIQGVVTSINKREPKAKYNSQMENDLYREIRKVAGDCYMSVIFDSEKFTLKKKYYQKRFTNSALDLPPIKSKDVKNTVIYNNGVNNHEDDRQKNIDNGDDEDIINLDDHDDDIILLCDSDANDIAAEHSLKTTELIDSNPVAKTVDSSEKTAKRPFDDEQDSDICDDTLSKDLSVDISNESLLLEMFEAKNDIEELKETLLDNNDGSCIDNNEMCDSASDVIKKGKEESPIVNCSKTLIHSSGIKNSSPVVRKDLEINNNFNIIENRNSATVVKQENSGVEVKDDETTTVTPESGIVADEQTDLSPSSSKRSRSDSEDSDKISRKYKKIDNVVHVRITSRNTVEEITVDAVLQLQSRISESIDNSFFLPLLQCHGIKNGGLIYSCYDDKSLLWLKNVLSELDFTIKHTDYSEEKVNKLQFRVNYIDGIEKVLSRLELYNTGLNTNYWDVTDVQTNDGHEIVTVIVDDDSFKLISEANFSLFAGVDKALFSVVWE